MNSSTLVKAFLSYFHNQISMTRRTKQKNIAGMKTKRMSTRSLSNCQPFWRSVLFCSVLTSATQSCGLGRRVQVLDCSPCWNHTCRFDVQKLLPQKPFDLGIFTQILDNCVESDCWTSLKETCIKERIKSVIYYSGPFYKRKNKKYNITQGCSIKVSLMP